MNASIASFRLPRSSWIMPIIDWQTHTRFASRAATSNSRIASSSEAHLLVGDAEIVVALRVVDVDLLRRRPP